MTMPDVEVMLAAGGCRHTLNPFLGCDTCGRPPVGGRIDRVTALGFIAETIDGTLITEADAPSVKHLPLDVVRRLIVLTDNPRIPYCTIIVDPDKGERLFRFARSCTKMKADREGKLQPVGSLTVEVLEVRFLDTGHALRLYLHPLQGPILSTQDLYF